MKQLENMLIVLRADVQGEIATPTVFIMIIKKIKTIIIKNYNIIKINRPRII